MNKDYFPDELEQQIHKAVTREVESNISTEVKSEIIPFHALPIYKESTGFILDDEEKSVIVDGEFRKALSDKGNAVSKSAEVLENEKLRRVKKNDLGNFF